MCLQEKRINAVDALAHPYLDEGRLRYHSCMCKCCHNTPAGRQYTTDFEPACPQPFSYTFEDELTSMSRVKGTNSLYDEHYISFGYNFKSSLVTTTEDAWSNQKPYLFCLVSQYYFIFKCIKYSQKHGYLVNI